MKKLRAMKKFLNGLLSVFRTSAYELHWLGIILTVTILLFGGLTWFQFGEINMVLHDNDFSVPSYVLLTLTFLWLTLIVFGIREIKYKFNRKVSIIILLADNTLTLGVTGLVLYNLYVTSVYGGLIQGFIKGGFNSPLFGLARYIEWTGVVLLPLLLIFEIYLLTRLIKIRKK